MRKRTALVDQRINRRSVDSKALLEVREQQITNRPRNEAPTSPPLVPPPPPIVRPVPPKVPPPPPAPAAENDGVPPRPRFASPPPEDDGVPPRPKFATPPPENDESPAAASSTSATKVPVVAPSATAKHTQSSASPVRSGTPDTPSAGDEDKPIAGAGSAALHRSGSAETSRVRGPRVVSGTRGPRGPAGAGSASVAAAIHTRTGSIGRSSISNIDGLKRSSGKVSPVPAPADPKNYAPKKHGGKAAAGAFSRRPVGSEDEVEK